MHTDIDGAVHIARLAVGFDWSWTIENVGRFCHEAGWTLASSVDTGHGPQFAKLRTSLSITHPVGHAVYDPAFFDRMGIRGEEAKELLVYLADTVDEAKPEGRIHLTNSFAELAGRLSREFGSPHHRVNDMNLKVVWSLPGVVIFLSIDRQDGSVQLSLVNPIYQDHLNRIAKDHVDHDDDDDDDFDDDDGNFDDDGHDDNIEVSSRQEGFPRTWREFTSALALTLSRLPVNGELALAIGEGSGVRFEMGWHELLCLIPSNDKCPGLDKMVQEDLAKWVGLGWAVAPAMHNADWERSMVWPGYYHEYEAIAEAAIMVLCDVMSVNGPADVQLIIWNDQSALIPDIVAFKNSDSRLR